MANYELAIKFTDENYLTRAEVARTLGTNLIDPIWAQIINYRRQFIKQLNVFDIYNMPFVVTLSDAITNKIVSANNRCREVLETFSDMPSNSFEIHNLKREMFKLELRHYAKAKGIQINDVALDNILFNRNTNPLYQPVVNYYYAIAKYENNPFAEVNEDMLAEYLKIFNNNQEITSFYRFSEISTANQKVLINRELNGIPCKYIEDMMTNLLSYINNSTDEAIVKTSTVNYMLNYIKPFDAHNEEIALILSRYVLSKSGMEVAPAFIPLEKIFTDKADLFRIANKETQKLHDLTYYVTAFIALQEDAVRDFLDFAFKLRRNSAEQAYYGNNAYQTSIDNQKTVEEPKQSIESVNIPLVNEQTTQDINKVNEVKAERLKSVIDQTITTSKPKVSLSEFEGLDDKALRKAEINLLHKDPNLKKSQAHFYVRHCTLGECYTIQEFKQMERCVYETARTSMDGLARLGYYRREQIKNKFVYTPISKD